MDLPNCIITLTIIITIVPILKMRKDKQFGGYNIFLVLIGAAVLILNFIQNSRERRIINEKETAKHVSDSTNEAQIKNLKSTVEHSDITLTKIQTSLDSIGVAVNTNTGKIDISDTQLLKRIILTPKSVTNVTSINQKGGQTAKEIINNK